MSRKNKQTTGPKSRADEKAVARFVDGEMAASERAVFELRLEGDAVLRAAVTGAKTQSRSIQDAMPETLSAPAGFGSAVLDHVRCMPSRDELVKITEEEETVVAVCHFGQMLLVAAALILGVALLFSFNLLRDRDGNDLIADDGELVRQLDQQVRALQAEEAEAARKRLGIKKR